VRFTLPALALLLSSAGVGAAAPLSATATHDIQCFVMYSAAAGTVTDPQQKMATTMAVTYYYGRIRTHSPDLDVAQAAIEQFRILKGAEAKRIGTACEAEFKAMGNELLALGRKLQGVGNARPSI
jgi:hypothetical protein